jgi:hypothetical protein
MAARTPPGGVTRRAISVAGACFTRGAAGGGAGEWGSAAEGTAIEGRAAASHETMAISDSSGRGGCTLIIPSIS